MRTICFAIAGLSALLCSTSVYAADLAAQAVEPVAPVVTPYNWSGPYVGLHAGYGWGRENDDQSKLFPNVTPTTTAVAQRASRARSRSRWGPSGSVGRRQPSSTGTTM